MLKLSIFQWMERTVILVDTDDNGMGRFSIPCHSTRQESDGISFGRYPDGSSVCKVLANPTPAESNESETPVSDSNVPEEFNLCQNFPNPFNNTTVISFSLPEAAEIDLRIYNMLGQKCGHAISW